VRVRLWGIDAPERRQADGEASQAALARLCEHRRAEARVLGRDRYGRLLALVSCDGVVANREQVRRGWAWVYDRYVSRDDALHEVERAAREAAEGLWRGANPVPPWEWRATREGRAPPG
jgi:endonuclease YncB( thermonuclease family)